MTLRVPGCGWGCSQQKHLDGTSFGTLWPIEWWPELTPQDLKVSAEVAAIRGRVSSCVGSRSQFFFLQALIYRSDARIADHALSDRSEAQPARRCAYSRKSYSPRRIRGHFFGRHPHSGGKRAWSASDASNESAGRRNPYPRKRRWKGQNTRSGRSPRQEN